MYRVLIPTDFSENALGALHYGAQLFEGFSCTFYLLHVYTPVIRSSRFMALPIPGTEQNGFGREQALEQLAKIQTQIQRENQFEDHHYQILTSFNLLTEEIKEVATTLDLDLILMATRGASNRENIFMGSNAVRLVRKIWRFTILLLPPGFQSNNSATGILTTNLQRVCLPADLRTLTRKLRPIFGENAAHLHALPNNSRGVLVRHLDERVISQKHFDIDEPLLLLPEISLQPEALAFP